MGGGGGRRQSQSGSVKFYYVLRLEIYPFDGLVEHEDDEPLTGMTLSRSEDLAHGGVGLASPR
jgi:hypothetical protein